MHGMFLDQKKKSDKLEKDLTEFKKLSKVTTKK